MHSMIDWMLSYSKTTLQTESDATEIITVFLARRPHFIWRPAVSKETSTFALVPKVSLSFPKFSEALWERTRRFETPFPA